MVKAWLKQLWSNSSLSPQIFLLRTLLGLPILFLIWYWLAPWLMRPALELAKYVLFFGLPNLIETTDIQAYYLINHTYLGASTSAELPQGLARFAPNFFTTGQHYPFLFNLPINSLKYAYGLPILAALVGASPTPIASKLKVLLLGFGLVSLIVVWGLYFNTANLLALDLKPTLTDQAKLLWPLLNEDYMQILLALGYRIGFLIFPVVLPIMLWAQQHPALLQQLIHGLGTDPNK